MTTLQAEIGGWWAMCCVHDLKQIKTVAELENALEAINDTEFDGARYWPTLEAALDDLEQGLDGDFERGMYYALRSYFGLPMTAKSQVRS